MSAWAVATQPTPANSAHFSFMDSAWPFFEANMHPKSVAALAKIDSVANRQVSVNVVSITERWVPSPASIPDQLFLFS